MLVLSRKLNETIRIGDEICIRVVAVDSESVRLGVEAPADVSVHRGEVYERIQEENRAAASRPGMALKEAARLLRKQTTGLEHPAHEKGGTSGAS